MNYRPEHECGCPDYVTRCAHYDGRVVWLVSKDDATRELRRRGLVSKDDDPYRGIRRHAVYGPAIIDPAGPLTPYNVPLLGTANSERFFQKAEVAERDFERRCRELRGVPA